MTNDEEVATVVRLACLIEDRTDGEQRALLAVARRTDDALNRARRQRFRAEHGYRTDEMPLPDASNLEWEAAGTRRLEDGQKPVHLKERKRRPWADPSNPP